MIKIGITVLAALASVLLVSGSDILKPENDRFEDSHVGYDLHSDYFYYDDRQVSKEFTRPKHWAPLLSLGGQNENFIGLKAVPAVNPFAVAQMSGGLGDNNDRWDVKEVNGYQFIGLYHGEGSSFVVNKLRAHLLRNVANAVTSSLEFLDKADESNIERVEQEIRHIIASTFADVDKQIRSAMRLNDDSYAEATVAIVTKKSIIVAQAGNVRLLAYANNDEVLNLTDVPAFVSGQRERPQGNVFGRRKSKSFLVQPYVTFQSREVFDMEGDSETIKFLLLETPAVAASNLDGADVKIVLGEISQHKYEPREERELFSGAVSRIVSETLNRRAFLQKIFIGMDAAVILVGLDRDYRSIH